MIIKVSFSKATNNFTVPGEKIQHSFRSVVCKMQNRFLALPPSLRAPPCCLVFIYKYFSVGDL